MEKKLDVRAGVRADAKFIDDDTVLIIGNCPKCKHQNRVEIWRDADCGRPAMFDWFERCEHVSNVKKLNHRWYFYYKE